MAGIRSVNIEDDRIIVSLNVTEKEYELVKEDSKNLIILPFEKLKDVLTTGKLGNSNRIMIPKKFLERNKVKKLLRKVKARIFGVNSYQFLLIRLDEEKVPGVPKFD